MIAMTIFLFSLAIIGLFIYAPLYFKMLKYTIEKEKIEKKSGVLKQKKEIILISKIQHITTVKTPFSFNCVILIASGSKIVLPFLKKKDLEFFLDFY
ncbi:hypothetical protein FACS1894132_10100 [Clostridia bacterium]|nr:hypothetical protein FACS1894132_10100 [Clostridia bacterium]